METGCTEPRQTESGSRKPDKFCQGSDRRTAKTSPGRTGKTSEAAEAAWKESQRVLEQWQEIWRIDQKVCQALKPQMEERSEVMHQYEKINGLYQLLSGNRKNSRMDIETYVQRHYLEQILEAANQRFQDMSAGQFELRMCDIDKAGTGKTEVWI